jgi:serine phosphatase RsbU (regulator of sigma subunit)
MRILLMFCFSIVLVVSNKAQDYVFSKELDSIIKVLKVLPKDTNKVITLNNLVDQLWKKSHLDSALVYAEKSLDLAIKLNYPTGKGNVLTSIGIINAIKGDYPKALSSMNEALSIFLKLNDQKKIASAYNNLGNIFEKQGNYTQALEHHLKSLKIKEEMKDTLAMASSYNNIGIILKYKNNYEKALEYYNKGLEINIKANNKKSIGQAYNNIGSVYQDMIKKEIYLKNLDSKEKLYEICLENYFNALKIDEEYENMDGSATVLNNIGSLFFMMGKYSAALDYNLQALSLRKKLGDRSGMSGTLANLSSVYLKLNKKEDAVKHISESLKLALEIGAKERIKTSYKVYSEVDSAMGNYKEAYHNYKMYTFYLDSLVNEENTVKTTQMQMQFEFAKKSAEDSLLNANLQAMQKAEIDVQKAELAKREAEISSRRNQFYALIGGLFLVFVFSGFMYNRFRLTRKQNRLIELQKKQVDQKNLLVEKAHLELTEKNKEILDSINYAKRIQTAILPSEKLLNKYLKNAFILYKPKDIVAGDFYWLEPTSEGVLIAAADCTGHGVPGAMVSVVCNNGLNRSVREYGLIAPNEILDKTRDIIIQEFDKNDEDVSDGMDISLSYIDFKNKKLEWAGANNPLIIVRNNEIIELKPDKQPIGKFVTHKSFTLHQVELLENDVIYSFTDGFADQFGGPKGKKFMYKPFKELLLKIHNESMNFQKNELEKVFNEWKGEGEQIDDVCIIGVRM